MRRPLRRRAHAVVIVASLALAGCTAHSPSVPVAVSTSPTTAASVAASSAATATQSADTTSARETAPDPRVAALLAQMTVEEKVGQLIQVELGTVSGACNGGAQDPGQPVDACMAKVLGDEHVGSILSGGGQAPLGDDPESWAKMTNAFQKYAVESTRLHIPLLYGVDLVHGASAIRGATIFPQQLGMAATWDPALQQQVAGVTGKAAAAMGISWVFSPVADVARDARWGRYIETFGEDPVLDGQFVAATIRGLQDTGGQGRVAASVKHFAGYSQPLTGHDRTAAFLPVRTLQDVFLPPFQAAIDAGADTVMVNSGSVNGVPAHASPYLLRQQLRDRMGFGGVTISDWEDVRHLVGPYGVAATLTDAVAQSVSSGVDVIMEPSHPDEATTALLAAVKAGTISGARLDEAVSHVLALKFRLGLFDHPYVDVATAVARVIGTGVDLARKAVAESTVVLRNDAVLPLAKGQRILVTGPNADNVRAQMGGWTIGWAGTDDPTAVPAVTVLGGLKAAAKAVGATVTSAPMQSALTAAKNADVVLAVLGEEPPTDGNEGFNDKEVIALDTDQQQLVHALTAAGKKVIVVLVASRPLVLGSAAEADGIVMAWQFGSAGDGLADVLFGTVNPSGRLPVSWPKTVGDVPVFYQQLPGDNYGPGSTYEPAYPFGAGLSYTTFAVQSAAVAPASVAGDGTVTVTATVENTGAVNGDFVVPVYARYPAGPVLTPPRTLVGFARATVAAGQKAVVTIPVRVADLAITSGDVDGAGPRAVPKGDYTLLVGKETATFTVS